LKVLRWLLNPFFPQDSNPVDLHLKSTHKTVTSSFYPRLREVNQDSSFQF
jgi:hypothetical protein